MEKFNKYRGQAAEEVARKRAETAERERKAKERREKELAATTATVVAKEEPKIKEITDEEAAAIQQQQLTKIVKEDEKKEAEEEEDPADAGKMVPNAGNGADLPDYKWIQTLSDIEVVIKYLQSKIRCHNSD